MRLTELWGVKQHLQHVQDHRNTVEMKLHDAGFTPLGSGASASVWEIPKKPYVLKLFDADDTPYVEFVHMVKHSDQNPHFPFFRGSVVKLSDQVHGIRMERLKPIQVNWASATQRGFRVMMEALPLGSDWQSEVTSEFSEKESRDLQVALRKWPRLAEAGDQLVKLHKMSPTAHWDLHLDNVMFRGSTPVFTDPFAL